MNNRNKKSRIPNTKYQIPDTRNAGYIAIASAVIISALLLTIVSALSLSMYFVRFNIYDSFAKERSRALAESCADTAMLKLRQSSSYNGNETVTVEAGATCTISTIQTQGSQKIITTGASIQRITTNIKVTVSGAIPTIVSWEEVP